ncbi:BON domain-containing protein [Trichocoleus sp. FACHB-262]|uniref:BON domain-containing protein n=1 Tax=Trichocoleus sp. FACHB-262 TaxID=2692869 RepID=UPI00168A1F56|nr:BON domain-containing protein [Trichocoleus sp. FACHB-262]MBD2120748.1 BON domain-containing protein [Trichocoleus sp. FACHB-262]
MKKLTPLFLSSVLLLGLAACDTARTSNSSPDTATQPESNLKEPVAQKNQNDATSELRRRQLNSDIRAREQRNDATGDDAIRADGDLQSEVRSKLEANLPQSELTITAEEGTVTIAGTVVDDQQLRKIEPLAKQIKGVRAVTLKANVASHAQPDEPPAADSKEVTETHTN